MFKHGKKNPIQLKFQISKKDLECFIKKKSVSVMESDKNNQKRKTSRGKPKSVVKKIDTVHQQKLISSILKNAMEQQFSDPKQVTEMLNKMNLVSIDENNQSPTNDDDLLKSFEIFKEPSHKVPSSLNSFPLIGFKEEQKITNQQCPKDNQCDLSFGKQYAFKNFSTQMGTDVGTERSKHSDLIEMYPSLLENQYYVAMNAEMAHEGDKDFFMGLSKQQRQRKSTPIRGENEKFKINIHKIENDGRTTVMIRHIPNKYTQQMLIDEVNENHRYKYNFFYLPVDSYNPCNVGYAFINFIDTKFIPKFYLEFNGKRWSRFNSEKICELAYARIQGSTALINHFQNSNIMKAGDKRLRPFISFGEGGNSDSKEMKQKQQKM